MEEGEHGSTEELVLELREVGEEVQVVDFHQREVEQLEEKLAELGGQVREGRQNKLTQDNWRSRGSSRGGPRPRPRGRSWKAGC